MIGDILSFERFNLGGIWDKVRKDPERLLIGAVDPASSAAWGKVLGKDYAPMVNQMGGATSDTYRDAEAAGINTGPGKAMHGLASMIAGSYAGGYGMGQLGGGGASSASGPGLLADGGSYGTISPGAGGGSGLSVSSNPLGSGIGSSLEGGAGAAGTPWSTYVNNGMKGLQAASAAKGLLAPQQQAQAPQQTARPGPDMSAIFNAQQQTAQADTQQEMLRRQMQQQVIQGLLGARNGLA